MAITTDNITLADVTQEAYDNALSLSLDALRTEYPSLDLRAGTSVRALVLEPSATMAALNIARAERMEKLLSVTGLEDVYDEDSRAVLSDMLANFNIVYGAGARATGRITIRVDAARSYYLEEGLTFSTSKGESFSLLHAIRAAVVGEEDVKQDGATRVILLPSAGGGYLFSADVIAETIGVSGNISKGTALYPASSIYGLVDVSAWAQFSGGADPETTSSAISRIPEALSVRGFTGQNSIKAKLMDRFLAGEHRVVGAAVQGYGDPAQIRDKHNILGIATGGRADIFVRTGSGMPVTVITKKGEYVPGVGHIIRITADDAPGLYAIKSITDIASDVMMGSFAFTERREATAELDTYGHDIIAENTPEIAFTAYQDTVVTIIGAPMSIPSFKIEAYMMPGVGTIQAYVDAADSKNVFGDIVVRGALMCIVSVVATVRYSRRGSAPDIEAMKSEIANYINSRNFVTRLTRSEITARMLGTGATSADLGISGMRLQGRIYGADGTWRVLSGDSLDVADVAEGAALIDRDTVVFTTSEDMINIYEVSE